MAKKKHKISTLKYFLRSLKQIYMLITFKEKMVFFLLVLMAVFFFFCGSDVPNPFDAFYHSRFRS